MQAFNKLCFTGLAFRAYSYPSLTQSRTMPTNSSLNLIGAKAKRVDAWNLWRWVNLKAILVFSASVY